MALVDRFEVTRVINAPAHAIFSLICDPRGHVAIDSSGSLMGASGDQAKAVGDTFVIHMDRAALNDFDLGLYDMTVTITAFDQDRLLEWQPSQSWAHIYGYTLKETAAGTEVMSYCDWSKVDQEWKDSGVFPVISEGTLRATLGILDRTVVPRD
jgi:hypothetical protein